jgi:hypothetical protein
MRMLHWSSETPNRWSFAIAAEGPPGTMESIFLEAEIRRPVDVYH